MTLILPGVEIQVVKEIVVPQLNPAGIFGLIGICEDDPEGNDRDTGRASSYKAFRQLFGPSTEFSVPEAKLAFQNGVSEICFAPINSPAAQKATIELKSPGGTKMFKLEARAKGSWGNKIKVKTEKKIDDDDKYTLFRCILSCGDAVEFYDNVSPDPDHERYFLKVAKGSDMVKVYNPTSGKSSTSTTTTNNSKGKDTKKTTTSSSSGTTELPAEIESTLSGGSDPMIPDYEGAMELLEAEEDVDLVACHIDDWSDFKKVKKIYASIEAHCKVMSLNCFNRIGFGEVPPPSFFKNKEEEVKQIAKMTNTMNSDRFVIIAPHGALGAVVGLIGNLPVHYSPTFKTLSGVSELEQKYGPSHLKELLKANILALEAKRGKGIIVEKGICTSGEQISVQRVADRSVRGAKLIGDQFIGTLNNLSGRSALQNKCIEFFTQMEKDGAIVPNADGSDPAFKVDVYASDDDISKGIVRMDIAIRPVRAIDYIYGTILVRS